MSIKAKAYRLANAERIKEKEKEYRLLHKEEMKIYNRAYYKGWYLKNKEKKLKQCRDDRARNKRLINEYKALHSCIQCGEKNPILLVFHHKNMKEKENGIAVMASSSFSTEKLINEMKKCEILCFNCHVLVHDRMKRSQTNDTLLYHNKIAKME